MPMTHSRLVIMTPTTTTLARPYRSVRPAAIDATAPANDAITFTPTKKRKEMW